MLCLGQPQRGPGKGFSGTNPLFVPYPGRKYPLLIWNQAMKRRAGSPCYLSQELAPSLWFLLLLPRSHISQDLSRLSSLAQKCVSIFPGDQLPCRPCPGKQLDEDGRRVSAANASVLLLPLEAGAEGQGCSAWGAEMESIYVLTFRVCSRACGSASEALDPCMPRRAEIRDKKPSETPHPSLPRSSPWFSSFYGMEEYMPNCSWWPRCWKPCALIPLLRSCCLWEKHQENPGPLLCPKCTQEGWAAAAHAPLALLHLIQGTWKTLSHHPPTPLSHLPHPTGMLERGYVFIQTSQFIPVIPLLIWMGLTPGATLAWLSPSPRDTQGLS